MPILVPGDFPSLSSGETASVSILREGQPMNFELQVILSPDEPERGLVGIMRDNSFAYKPLMNFIEWMTLQFLCSCYGYG